MSRPRRYFDFNDPRGSSGNPVLGCSDEEFIQLTKAKSASHERLRRVLPGKTTFPVSPVRMLMGRECNYSGKGNFSRSDSCHLLSRYLPVHGLSVIDKMQSCAYVAQFSTDGSLFVAGFQESHIQIYNVDMGWKIHKNIRARSLRWTITDTSLSPDRRFLVYSSISPVVHIVDVGSSAKESHANVTEIHEGLEFSSNADDYDDYSFGIFSVKFSTDGREIVAASSDKSIYVYDLEARRLRLKIPAHMVWDRRCFVSKGQAAGVLMGHLEDITFIDTRGDGRYFISNGKDQSIKLWDIRKISSSVNYKPRRRYAQWDYRWMEYPEQAKNIKHSDDLSIATYKGHTVLRTLIRCYFSPAYSTGQKYIYTGSTDNSVYVYDVMLIGHVAYEALKAWGKCRLLIGHHQMRNYSETLLYICVITVVSGGQVAKLDFHEDPVRDCNWHPYYPMMVSSSWDGTLASWEFPGKDCENPLSLMRTRRRG